MRQKERGLAEHIDTAGWVLDEENTTKRHTVWVNEDSKEVVTSFRGTAGLDDLPADMAIAFGTPAFNKRFKDSARDYGDILEQYADHTHVLSGHSLGASINNHLHQIYGDRIDSIHNFNPGSGVNAVLSGLGQKLDNQDYSNIHSYYVHGDPISTLGQLNGTHNVHHVKCCASRRVFYPH